MPAVFSSLSMAASVLFLLIAMVLASFVPSSTLAQGHLLPNFIDWRDKGVVAPAPNQGECGDAALFAAVSNIQAVSAITNGNNLVPLSYKELETCMDNGRGCDGGFSNQGPYKWLLEQGGIITSNTTTITRDSCQDPSKLPVGAKITSVRSLIHSELEIHKALVDGPVFVTLDASSWETYTGGTLDDCSSKQIDHAALVVGINTAVSYPYWIIQNSWGPNWGVNGYIQIRYGSNQCGITSSPITVSCAKL